MYPELDVKVDMSCTPMMSYDELKQMWLDGIISKENFAHHAFHLHALPMDQIEMATQQPQ